MSKIAVIALRSEITRAQQIFNALTPAQWAAPSGCTNWRVQDVACHMASVFHSIAGPDSIEGGAGKDAEVDAEVPVQARKNWTPQQVMAEYDEWSEIGFAALSALQEPPMNDTVVPLSNLGAHPMHLLANAIVFDHYCHLRHDIGLAVPTAAALPQDPDALNATLEWMLAGTPQMCATALAICTQGVNLVFTGSGASSYTLSPGANGWTVLAGVDASFPTATGSAHDFVSWATQRADWRKHVTLTADPTGAAANTLDAINVI